MPRTLTLNRCPHDQHMLAVEDRGGGGSKKILGGSGHHCTWSEVWRYAFQPIELAAKLVAFAFHDGPEVPTGAIVQVMEPAADGTTGMVGMVGIVTPFDANEVCEIPDAGGVPVYFGWPDSGLHGRVAHRRLRLVGHTSFVPSGTWHRGGVVTVENDSITPSNSDGRSDEEKAAANRLALLGIDVDDELRKFSERFWRSQAEPLNANAIASLREWLASWPLDVDAIPIARSTLTALIDAASKETSK